MAKRPEAELVVTTQVTLNKEYFVPNPGAILLRLVDGLENYGDGNHKSIDVLQEAEEELQDAFVMLTSFAAVQGKKEVDQGVIGKLVDVMWSIANAIKAREQ